MSGDSAVSPTAVLPPEALVQVRINDAATLEWSCTPSDLSALAAGWFVCEGVVRSLAEIQHLEVEEARPDHSAVVSVRLARAAADRLQQILSRDAVPSVRPAVIAAPHDVLPPGAASQVSGLRPLLENRVRLASWFRDMFDGASLRASVGGVHTGGLVMGGSLALVVEDVSRHHVVDRLVGSALRRGAPLPSSILLVSARISGAMAAKACRAGVGALVSRSVPTQLAAAVAGRHGLILVGRARREVPSYYWPEAESTS